MAGSPNAAIPKTILAALFAAGLFLTQSGCGGGGGDGDSDENSCPFPWSCPDAVDALDVAVDGDAIVEPDEGVFAEDVKEPDDGVEPPDDDGALDEGIAPDDESVLDDGHALDDGAAADDGGPMDDGGALNDGGPDDGGDDVPDVPVPDDGLTADDGGVPDDGAQEDVVPCQEPKEFQCPCADHDECASGLCVETDSFGAICSAPCVDCPAGPPAWGCAQVDVGTGTLQDVCYPYGEMYCLPCEFVTDCLVATDHCLDVGGADYCVQDCADDTCPDGYSCTQVGAGPRAEPVDACIPDGNACPGCVDGDTDGYGAGTGCLGPDCNDEDLAVNPGAEEVCNGMDENCDSQTDEGFPNLDQDNLADCVDPDIDGDGDLNVTDCEPENPEVFSQQVETCGNNVDDDCDGGTDDEGAEGCNVYFHDFDQDGYGTEESQCLCEAGVPFNASGNGDCADENAAINPESYDLCNGIDDDCDGVTDNDFPDADDDGIADCVDPDRDGDDVLNEDDNCPDTYNPDQGDVNDNGVGDACEDDWDGDGFPNGEDNCPWVWNQDQANMDLDEFGDACDCDIDDDTVTNNNPGCTVPATPDNCPETPNPDQLDMDADGLGDLCDPDRDGDDVANEVDNCPDTANPGQEDENQNQVGDACEDDWDGDGVVNDLDNCPWEPNSDQADGDGDLIGDACDCDIDGDGFDNENPECPVPDPADNCPVDPNPLQEDLDLDDEGDTCDLDDDGDGIFDVDDNCPGTPNPGQEDANQNDIGDACENDWDGDGILNDVDNCPYDKNSGQEDQDGDTLGDVCDCDVDGDFINNAGHNSLGEECTDPVDNCPLAVNPGQDNLDGDEFGDECDADRDGDLDPNDEDCGPDDAAVNHAATEACNGKDDDCDGETDEAGADGCSTFYRDEDVDTYGTGDTQCLCAADTPYTATQAGDCDDQEAAVNPVASEVCNDKDDNCDSHTDEEGAEGCVSYYVDSDTDGYGTGDPRCLCGPEFPHNAVSSGDCDDTNIDISPEGEEVCNGEDDDCNGQTDEGFPDDDKDGIANCVDDDRDQDGIPDNEDNCPDDPNPGQEDMDGDQIGDACDLDRDGDGFDNLVDNCPDVANAGQEDNDDDGQGDACDDDDDNDTVPDGDDNCPMDANTDQADMDTDDIGDVCDPDRDGDDVANGEDNCPDDANPGQEDNEADGKGDVCDDDDDDDTVLDDDDNCPLDANTDQADMDVDDLGDVCDPDRDGDEVLNDPDNCPDDANPGQEDNEDDGLGDVCDIDDDNDGWPDDQDNCPFDYNPDQADLPVFPDYLEGDGVGDVCDPDDDNDGIDDDVDNCPGTYNPDQEDLNQNDIGDACEGDLDGDGVPNATDNCVLVPNPGQEDQDGDDLGDVCDCDIDGDLVDNANPGCPPPNPEDNCTVTPNPQQEDMDLNGVGDACDPDIDGDGDPNDTDCGPTDPAINHGAAEVCNDKDDDCDGDTDEGNATGCTTWYLDVDGDGYGVAGDTRCRCAADGDYKATVWGDCDDGDLAVYPGATESCNTKDDNCDGDTDEEDAQGCSTFYYDNDEDTYGVTGNTRCLCAADGKHTASQGNDCSDSDAAVHPGVTEVCNGKDDDCNGGTDEENSPGCERYYYDFDGDNYGTIADDWKCLCAALDLYRAPEGNDCDDEEFDVNPSITESCNLMDDNCDGFIDELDATGCTVYMLDYDADTFGVTGDTQCQCSPSHPYSATQGGDCADDDGAVNPNVPESCNGKDDDCDVDVDEENAFGCLTLYYDGDSDNFGIAGDSKCLCQEQGLYTSGQDGDCKDDDADVYPGATETCDGKDNDCDGNTDEEDAGNCTVYYFDDDGDGYGLESVFPKCLCAAAAPFQAVQTGDCNDADPDVKPGAVETCNGKDDDCNGTSDLEDSDGCDTYYADGDGDSYGLDTDSRCLCDADGEHTTQDGGDCDDVQGNVNPGAAEICGNNVDDNCDDFTDEEGCLGCAIYYLDVDDDTYGVTGDTQCLSVATGDYTASRGGDCDDALPTINPGATETCGNAKDDDCDQAVDEENASGCTPFFHDEDDDGWGTVQSRCLCAADGFFKAAQTGDCDDINQVVNPDATEVCNNLDDDCNGQTDDEGATDCTPFYLDADQDTYGLTGNTKCLCGAQGDYDTATGGDCDDEDGLVNPGQAEACNAKDDDCDGLVDEEAGAPPCTQYATYLTLYLDKDGDTYGLIADAKCLCEGTGQYTGTTGGDCDDDVAAVNPGQAEVCQNNMDDNCNGDTDEIGCGGCIDYYLDMDGDTYGQTSSVVCLSEPSEDYPFYTATRGGDCNDVPFSDPDAALVNPNAPEVCNGKDDDCDYEIDEQDAADCTVYYYDNDGDFFGVDGDTECRCNPSGKYTAPVGGDCNDETAGGNVVYPGRRENCNDIDDDCDGNVDEYDPGDAEYPYNCVWYYLDDDQDNFGISTDLRCLCDPEGKYSATQGTGSYEDCDDTKAWVNPSAIEKCGNGTDDDCDGNTDDVAASCPEYPIYYNDQDEDGYGDDSDTVCQCGPSGTYTAETGGDCADGDADVNPGMDEVCGTAKDEDCSGSSDEEDCLGCTLYYLDLDMDTYGVTGDTKCLAATANNYTAGQGGDCNDGSGAVNPGAQEVCDDNVDNDCDGNTDEEGCQGCITFYKDQDDDGWGLEADSKCLSAASGAYRAIQFEDCDDADDAVNPSVNEVCNAVDDDCDGDTDETDAGGCTVFYKDQDDDTYGVTLDNQCLCVPVGHYDASVGGDCNDDDGAINPAGDEVCNGQDDDCNGDLDDEGSPGCEVYYFDNDDDDYGTALSKCLCGPSGSYSTFVTGDCDDFNVGRNPGATEICNNVDDDCDNETDEEGTQGCQTWYFDFDGDLYGDTADHKCLCATTGYYTALEGGDCNDVDMLINPGVAETCSGKDDNCDGATDPENAQGCTVWNFDADDDGYGTNDTKCLCGTTGDFTATQAGDCDDSNGDVSPDGTESCNSVDDDCDGQIDVEDSVGCTTYHLDGDGDGYGLTADTRCYCQIEGQYNTETGGDCNDDVYAINPGTPESCNGVDDNCNDDTDEDPDNELCGAPSQATVVCEDGACALVACNEGYYNINGQMEDGCECQVDSNDATANTCADAVDLGNFSDAQAGGYQDISGRIVPDTDVDWYKFTALDTADAGDLVGPGQDNFHVQVEMILGDDIKVNVYRGACDATVECNGGNSTMGLYDWFTDFVDQKDDVGEGTCLTTPGPRLWDCCKPDECEPGVTSESDACCGGTENDGVHCDDTIKDLRYCNTDTNTFWVRVARSEGAAGHCLETQYILRVRNRTD